MPETITREVTIYTFKELVDKKDDSSADLRAYERARDWLIEGATGDSYWYEGVIDQWKECLEQFGFMDPEVYFSGFWSQGDGACFSCKYVDRDKLIDAMVMNQADMKAEITFDGKTENFIGWANKKIGGWFPVPGIQRLKLDCIDLSVRVYTIGHHYSHSNTRRLEVTASTDSYEYNKYRNIKHLVSWFEEVAERLRKDLSDAIYKDLEDEYDYRTEDEQLIEDAQANEYKFDGSGGVEY